jgi:type VI protein secretion system component Hcp
MKKYITAFAFLFQFLASDAQDVFVRLTDMNGKQIVGTSVTRGYEKTLPAFSMTSAGKNNSQITFTTTISGASAELIKAKVQGEFLMNGQITVTQPGNRGQTIIYKINLEKITVNNCVDAIGCNNTMGTTVTITASRIGWTYYQQDKTGISTVSNKYGFDNETGRPWTNF